MRSSVVEIGPTEWEISASILGTFRLRRTALGSITPASNFFGAALTRAARSGTTTRGPLATLLGCRAPQMDMRVATRGDARTTLAIGPSPPSSKRIVVSAH